jgi:SsrA-binding protein
MSKDKKQFKNNINIRNKRARFDYEILDKYIAGIQLVGTEIKAIREGKASLADSFCEFNDRGELFVVNMYINEYSHGTHYNHQPKRERKLLLNKKELKKLRREVEKSGLTIVPLRMFITDKGWAKMEIGLAKGRKKYDKRELLKERDIKRQLDQVRKEYR